MIFDNIDEASNFIVYCIAPISIQWPHRQEEFNGAGGKGKALKKPEGVITFSDGFDFHILIANAS